MSEPSRKRVVLVDDEDDLVWSLKIALARELGREVDVRATSDAAEALAFIDESPCDLLITDVRMPSIDGMELLIRARRARPGLPALVMTAFPSEHGRQRAIRFGSVTYLEKPFELASFIALVTEIVAQRPAGFSGAMSLEGLSELVQLFAMSRSTGSLRIARLGRTGVIWFDRGAIVHAEQGAQSGVEAFHEILRWADGEFSMERHTEAPARTISASATELLRGAAGEGELPRAPVDEDVLAMMPRFLRTLERDIGALEAALGAWDVAAIARLGHGMKGSASSFGFPEISRLGGQLEEAARAGDERGIRATAEALSRYVKRVLAEVV